jgi:transcriptional regulator with XRE-family HTH domain
MRRIGDPADLRLLVIFLRSLRGWTQKELAERAGVDKGAISDYELGKTAPSEKTLRRIVQAVGAQYAKAERLLPVFRSMRLGLEEGEPRDRGGTSDPAGALVSRLARAAGEAVEAGVTPSLLEIPVLSGLGPPASPAEERRNAAALWDTVKGLSPKDREKVVTVAPGYHTSAFCELLCHESERAAADQAERAVELAALARRLAE